MNSIFTSAFIDMSTKSLDDTQNTTHSHVYLDTFKASSDKREYSYSIPHTFDILRHFWVEDVDVNKNLVEANFTANDYTVEKLTSPSFTLLSEFYGDNNGILPFGFSRLHGFPVIACLHSKLVLNLTFAEPVDNLRVGVHVTMVSSSTRESIKTKKFDVTYPVSYGKRVKIVHGGYTESLTSLCIGNIACILFKPDVRPNSVKCFFEMATRFDLTYDALNKHIPSLHGMVLPNESTAMMYSFVDNPRSFSESETINFDKILSCALVFDGSDATYADVCFVGLRKLVFSRGTVGPAA